MQVKDHYLTCGKCEKRVEPEDYIQAVGAGGNATADEYGEGLLECGGCKKHFGPCCGFYDERSYLDGIDQYCDDSACKESLLAVEEAVKLAEGVAAAAGGGGAKPASA